MDKCWGTDELRPVDGTNNNWLGLGLTIVDSLDTLWIMDLKADFKRARDWVAKNLDFNKVSRKEIILYKNPSISISTPREPFLYQLLPFCYHTDYIILHYLPFTESRCICI